MQCGRYFEVSEQSTPCIYRVGDGNSKVEAVCFFETLANFYQSSLCHIPQHSNVTQCTWRSKVSIVWTTPPDVEYVMGGRGLYPSQWEILLKGSELQWRGSLWNTSLLEILISNSAAAYSQWWIGVEINSVFK